ELAGLLSLALLERTHHASEERVELHSLALVQSGGDQQLLLRLDPDRLLPELLALLGRLDEPAPPVLRITDASHQPGFLELVEAARHRAARQVGEPCELAGGPPVRLAGPAQRRKHLVGGVAEAVLGQSLV